MDLLQSKGFPIKEITYEFGEIMDDTELIEATELDLPSSTFDSPSGYQKAKILEVFER